MDEFTLPEMLANAVAKNPDKIAVRGADVKYSYQQFYDQAQAVAQGLCAQGINYGDRVAIALENSPAWGICYFAIQFAGAVAVPIDPQASKHDLKYFLKHSAAKLLFTDSRMVTTFANFNVATLQKIISNYAELAVTTPHNLPRVIADDLASILYTSGTTALPKGVLLTHRNFSANFSSLNQLGLTTANDNMLAVLPLHHSFPFMVTLLAPLFTGNTITYPTTLNSEAILQAMRSNGVTIFPAVPNLLAMLAKGIAHQIASISWFLRWPLKLLINCGWLLRRVTGLNVNRLLLASLHHSFGKKLRFFVSGGASLDPALHKLLSKLGFTVLQGYGLTETSPVVSFNRWGLKKSGSVGVALPGVTVAIINEEVVVKGPNVMRGYYKDEAATKTALRGGWFHTGDRGYLDKEGFLFLSGRSKELIVLSSGKNINPEEAEAHYGTSPYIKELCITTTPKAEQLVAVIYPDLEYFRTEKLVDLYGSIKWDLENLSKDYPSYKRITGFVLAKEELPKTRLGKLKRYLIQEQYLSLLNRQKARTEPKAEPTGSDLEIYNSLIAKKLLPFLAKTLSATTAINLDDHLELDLGIDSLRRAELLLRLEQEFACNIPSEAMATVFTVRELIAEIAKLAPATAATTKATISWHQILQQDPPPKLLAKLALEPSWSNSFKSQLIGTVLWGISKSVWWLRVRGSNNLPKERPFIICANHASYLDGPFLAAALPAWIRNKVFTIAYDVIFSQAILKQLARALHIIPISQTVQLIEIMQLNAYLLRQQRVLTIFPAGARSIDGTVQEFKSGVGILAKELNVPLVPVIIKGSFEAWPRGRKLPKPHRVTVNFGNPLEPAELEQRGKALGAKTAYEAIAIAIRAAIINLTQGE